jgi:multiple sugar transport system permease protein
MTVTRTAPQLQTIPVGIYLLRGAYTDETRVGIQQAAIFLSILPVMITFLLLQRFYVRGLTSGSVKG